MHVKQSMLGERPAYHCRPHHTVSRRPAAHAAYANPTAAPQCHLATISIEQRAQVPLPLAGALQLDLDAYLDALAWRFNNRDNPWLFRDTLIRLLRSEHLLYQNLIA